MLNINQNFIFLFDTKFSYKNFDLKWDTQNAYLGLFGIGGVDYPVSVPLLRLDFPEGVTGEAIVQGLKLQAFPKDAQRVFSAQLKFLTKLHQRRAAEALAHLPKDFEEESPLYKQFAYDSQGEQYYTEMRQVMENDFDLSVYMNGKTRELKAK